MRTRAVPDIASCFAAARDRSMTRPRPWGPRSLIVTSTALPFCRLVTRARLPRGKRGWAAVSRFWLKIWPLAVFLPWNPGPYQEALPTCGPLAPASSGMLADKAKTPSKTMREKLAVPRRVNRALKGYALRSFKSRPPRIDWGKSMIFVKNQLIIQNRWNHEGSSIPSFQRKVVSLALKKIGKFRYLIINYWFYYIFSFKNYSHLTDITIW